MLKRFEHRDVETNGVTLHIVQAGPADGPLLLLLHGFPECWYAWRAYIAPLADAGYRVWVPDQRGYNQSSKPRGVGAYTLETLGRDILGLIAAAGREKAAVVGHDWGGAVAWELAMRHPARVERVAILNALHPLVWRRALRGNLAQMRRSWYVYFFQIPGLPEAVLRRDNWRATAASLEGGSRPGTFSAEDLAVYRAAWSQAGAITGMLNWYRALRRRPLAFPDGGRVAVPVRLIWGARDPFAGVDLARRSLDFCDDGQLELIEGATHWVQHEARERVLPSVERFLR